MRGGSGNDCGHVEGGKKSEKKKEEKKKEDKDGVL